MTREFIVTIVNKVDIVTDEMLPIANRNITGRVGVVLLEKTQYKLFIYEHESVSKKDIAKSFPEYCNIESIEEVK